MKSQIYEIFHGNFTIDRQNRTSPNYKPRESQHRLFVYFQNMESV